MPPPPRGARRLRNINVAHASSLRIQASAVAQLYTRRHAMSPRLGATPRRLPSPGAGDVIAPLAETSNAVAPLYEGTTVASRAVGGRDGLVGGAGGRRKA
ncbi:UNVERIFIED_CONTAM: hypothetical protein Sradi_0695600 [Sesamum radiatum]|uniref:Uncharacterized protein n=1 Tax=Sesamum radiatum TaxID=300843 RepID=A0AAW2VQH0_SESRA